MAVGIVRRAGRNEVFKPTGGLGSIDGRSLQGLNPGRASVAGGQHAADERKKGSKAHIKSSGCHDPVMGVVVDQNTGLRDDRIEPSRPQRMIASVKAKD